MDYRASIDGVNQFAENPNDDLGATAENGPGSVDATGDGVSADAGQDGPGSGSAEVDGEGVDAAVDGDRQPARHPGDDQDQVDLVTTLQAARGRRATKRFTLGDDGEVTKEDYDAGLWYRAFQIPVRGVQDFWDLLERLQERPRCLIVRGLPRPDFKRRPWGQGGAVIKEPIRRCFNPPADGSPPGLVRESGRYAMFDCDGHGLPEELSVTADPDAVVDHILELLPPEFDDLALAFQWSASAGFNDPRVAKFHIWVLLDQPYTYEQLRDYVLAGSPRIKFDRSAFVAAQPNYIADPVTVGTVDPLAGRRLVFIEGSCERLKLPPAEVVEAALHERAKAAGKTIQELRELPGGSWREKLAAMGDGEGGFGFHRPLRDAAFSFVAEGYPRECWPEFKAAAREAILAAPGSDAAERRADVARYSGDPYLDNALKSAFEKAWQEPVDPAIEFGDLPEDEPEPEPGDGTGDGDGDEAGEPPPFTLPELLWLIEQTLGSDSDGAAIQAVLHEAARADLGIGDEDAILWAIRKRCPRAKIDKLRIALEKLRRQRRERDQDDPRPILKSASGNLHRSADEIERRLLASSTRYGSDPIFMYSERLVTVSQDTPKTVKQKIESGYAEYPPMPMIRYLNTDSLKKRIMQTTRVQTYNARIDQWCDAAPSPELVSMVMNAHGRSRILTGIVEAPCITGHGRIIGEAGYDLETGLFAVFDPDAFPAVPDRPSLDDARAAYGVLVNEALDGWEFGTPLDEAVAVSALLSCLCRRGLDAGPAYLSTSQKQSSGKSSLWDLVSRLAFGRPVPVTPWPGDGPEMTKSLLAILSEGHSSVLFDNLDDDSRVVSSSLSTAVTGGQFRSRILGTNVNASLPTNCMFFITGNRLRLTKDMATRVVPCVLAPNTARPDLRLFRRNDLGGWCRVNRGRMVAAALTIMRAYLATVERDAGAAVQCCGRFHEWDHLVRAPLAWLLGEAGDVARKFDANHDDLADQEGTLHDQIAEAIHEALGGAEFTAESLWAVYDEAADHVAEDGAGRLKPLLDAWCDHGVTVAGLRQRLAGLVNHVTPGGRKLVQHREERGAVRRRWYRIADVGGG
jgi:hypothetical protein